MPRTEGLRQGLWGVLATPFTSDDRIDDRSLNRQLQLHGAAGSVGLVALGVFGEAARLSPPEQDHVVDVVTSVHGDAPVVVGLPERDTAGAISTAVRLMGKARRPVRFMVQVNSPDPGALADHLTAIHESTGAGVVIQDYPAVTGVEIAPSALAEVVRKCSFVAAVKSEAPPTSVSIARLAPLVDVPVFGGLGGLGLLDELMAGAAGAMTGFSFPEALATVVTAFEHGGYAEARVAYLPWLPLVNFEAQRTVGLAIRKASLVERAVFEAAAVRPPGVEMDPALVPLLREHLAPVRDLGVL